jgi:hypothetical protein
LIRSLSPRLRLLLAALAVVGAGLACYAGSFDNFFWNDDFWWLNHTRRTASDPLLVFEDIIGCFRPLVNLYFAAAFHVFGLSAPLYRIAALAIHLLNAALLGVLASRLFRSWWSGFLATTAFTVGWVHYEVVYWVSAASDLLAVTTVLGCVLLYVRFLDGRSRSAYGLAIAVAAASLLVKESAVVLPLILLLVHLVLTRKALVRLTPFWGLALLLLALEATLGVFARHGVKYGPGVHMFTNLISYARFIVLEPFGPWAWLRPIVASGLLLPLVTDKRTRWVTGLGAAWLVVGLLPVSQWRFMEQVESRWCYLPTAGLSLCLGGWGVVLCGTALWKRAIAAAVAAAFCVHNGVAVRGVEQLEHLRFAELQRGLIGSIQSLMRPETRRIVVSHFPPFPEWQVDDISDLYFGGKLVRDDGFPIPEGERISTPEMLVFTYSQERAVLR